MNRLLALRWGVPLAWALGAAPLAWLWFAALADRLGANPAEALIRQQGLWALRWLCLALAITPLRIALGWPALARYRRVAGLLCFGYATAHFLSYAWFELEWSASALATDVRKRPFILVGTLALLLLAPLAATSTAAAMRRLGPMRWQRLHRLVFAAAPLALLHFSWMRDGKRLYGEVWFYGGLLAALLGWRLWHRWRKARRGATS